MSLHAPLYCAICAAPCLLPRVVLPENSPETFTGPIGQLIPRLPNQAISPDTQSPLQDNHEWQTEWHVLQVSSGLITTFQIIPPGDVPTNPSGEITDPEISIQRRAVPIHQYCLYRISKTILRSQFNNGFSHEGNMMFGWSIPKWTGCGPWVHPHDRGIPKPHGHGSANEETSMLGYWRGCVDQRDRWRENIEGSHLLEIDHASPAAVGSPVAQKDVPNDSPQIPQTSKLPNLPSHILVQVAHDILDEDPSQIAIDKGGALTTQLIPQSNITDLLSFTRCCTDLNRLELPNAMWRSIILAEVKTWRMGILSRWRANPSGAGSDAQLWIALNQDIVDPIEKALAGVRSAAFWDEDTDEDEESLRPRYSARDVWRWWAYDPAWRSRRRIWYCLVHACATARDADWW